MYHYGPYSSGLSGELNFAEQSSIIEVTWKDNEGYFIKPTSDTERVISLLNADELQAVDEIVTTFGKFKAIDLSLIATAQYLRDNFEIEDNALVGAVHNAKRNYTRDYITKVLKAGNVLSN